MKRSLIRAAIAAAGLTVLMAGNAGAAMIHLEVSGNLALGTDATNVFGLGSNYNLTGTNATFFWNIDSTRLGPDRDAAASVARYDCGVGRPGCSYFMTAGVTINGVTRQLVNSGSDKTDDVRLYADTDGAALASGDGYYLRVGQSRDVGNWYLDSSNTWYRAGTRISSKVEASVQDLVQSILNGVDPLELNGWATNALTGANDSGSAVFAFAETDLNGVALYEFATGTLLLADQSVRWWTGATQDNDGTGGTTGSGAAGGQSVPEPSSLALLAAGLGLAGWTRRSRA